MIRVGGKLDIGPLLPVLPLPCNIEPVIIILIVPVIIFYYSCYYPCYDCYCYYYIHHCYFFISFFVQVFHSMSLILSRQNSKLYLVIITKTKINIRIITIIITSLLVIITFPPSWPIVSTRIPYR